MAVARDDTRDEPAAGERPAVLTASALTLARGRRVVLRDALLRDLLAAPRRLRRPAPGGREDVGADVDALRRAVVGDVIAATLAQLSAALVGGAVAVLFGPPQVPRRPTAAACVLACLIALVALPGPLGDAGGPIAVARTLTDAPAGHVTVALVVACASSLGFAAIALAAAQTWLRHAR